MSRAGTVVIFLKSPIAGRVKTRLGSSVGYGRAAALFRHMTAWTIRHTVCGPWRTILAVDPPSGATSGWEYLWPPQLERFAQTTSPASSDDLGQRMGRFFERRTGPVIIIGADAPGLRTRHIRQAFKALGPADAVFGPAQDGGYWLIGLAQRKPAPQLFEKVRWSGPHALKDTLASLPDNFRNEFLAPLADIDEASDLERMRTYTAAR